MRRRAWAFASALVALGCAADDIVLFRLEPGGAGAATAPGGSGGTGALPLSAGGFGFEAGGTASGGALTGNGGIIASGGITDAGKIIDTGGTAGAGGSGGIRGSGGDVPDSGAGGGCSTEFDCPSGWTCSKLDCAAPTGSCEPKPILCDPAPQPVCGCNHVTYWNDCQRRQSGVAASTAGQCGVGTVTCNTSLDCGLPGAFCAHVWPSAQPCGAVGPGTCWMLPVDCTNTPPAPKWIPCSATGPGPTSPFGNCVDTCTAIQSGQQYTLAPPGTVCSP